MPGVLRICYLCLVGVFFGLLVASVKAQLGAHCGQHLGTNVAGHDDDGVLEVHRAALRIRDAAIVQNLEHDVSDVLVGLFDLVEQHHGVGLTAHLFGELATLIVAHIARRRTHQTGHRMTLHVLGHINADHGVLIAEHGFGQRLAQLRLTHAGGTEEQKAANGALGVLQAHAATADGPGDRFYSLVLTHHTLVEDILHVQQALPLVLGQAG